MNAPEDVLITQFPDPELFSAILEVSSEVVWVKDYDRDIDYWLASEIKRQKYGIPPGNVDRQYWPDNLHPEDRKNTIDGFNSALKNRDVTLYEHEYRFRGSHGSYYVIHDKLKFIRDSNGKVKRIAGVWRDVTNSRARQQKLEQALVTLEAEKTRFKYIAQVSNASMWEIDFENRKIEWFAGSKTLEEFGLDKVFSSREAWAESIHPDDRVTVLQYMDGILASNQNRISDTYRVRKKNGTYASVLNEGTVIRNAEGKPVRALGGWIDITQEREREAVLEQALKDQRELNEQLALREEELTCTEEELRQINDQLAENVKNLSEHEFILTQSQRLAKIASWDYNVYLKTMYWSDEMYSIYGVDKNFNVNDLSEIYRLFEPTSRALIAEMFNQTTHTHHSSFDIMAQMTTPLGYKKWLRITAYHIFEDGRLRRILGLTYDITYLKEAEERLRASEQKFSSAFRNNPDLMTITREEDLIIIDVNEKTLPLLGYERDEVVGQLAPKFNFFVNPTDRDTFYKQYTATGKVEIECPWRRKDGTSMHALISSSRLEFDGKKYFISVIKDISDRKAAEEKLIVSEANLNSVINNTSFVIWSVDNNYNLIAFNERLQTLLKTGLDVDLKYGERVIPLSVTSAEAEELRQRWKVRYEHALSGNCFKVSAEPILDRFFEFSVNPIMDGTRVKGISVFGEDVTERIKQENDLAEAKEMIGELKLTALRSVMNPHFIFNALNSIQFFIAKNDRENAINYLSTFSKLIRGILSNSVQNKIKLAEEIELLKHYISLELIRFDNKFEVIIDVDEKIDADSIEVPSLLIQPLVENAILHGLYSKKGKGLLKIKMRASDNNCILVEIEDNGIGREAAAKLQLQNFPKHKSVGSRLTGERIKIINQGENASFEIIDLFKEGKPAGTLVKLKIAV